MTKRVAIFEDKQEQFDEVAEPLRSEFEREEYQLDRFTELEDDDEETMAMLRSWLQEDIPILAVLDWDLTEYESGVRREHVQSACSDFGIPLCVYHRDEGRFSNPDELQEFEEDLIRIDPKDDPEDLADSIGNIARTFDQIHQRLISADSQNPQSAIFEIIDPPGSAESKLDQYSLGYPETLQVAKTLEDEHDRLRVVSTLIGYWIYNQLLGYPGVLLNCVATASYLQVNHEQFCEDEEYQLAVKAAKYEGPFSDLGNWWWLPRLDELRAQYDNPGGDGLINGPSFFNEHADLEIEPVHCEEGDHNEAGYYCILTEKPICKEDSVRPKGWIPAGATQSRIAESEFEKVSAWVSG